MNLQSSIDGVFIALKLFIDEYKSEIYGDRSLSFHINNYMIWLQEGKNTQTRAVYSYLEMRGNGLCICSYAKDRKSAIEELEKHVTLITEKYFSLTSVSYDDSNFIVYKIVDGKHA